MPIKPKDIIELSITTKGVRKSLFSRTVLEVHVKNITNTPIKIVPNPLHEAILSMVKKPEVR